MNDLETFAKDEKQHKDLFAIGEILSGDIGMELSLYVGYSPWWARWPLGLHV